MERFFSYSRFFNPFATLYLNFRTVRFRDAIRLPIFVYGRVDFVCLRGRILIESPICSGMIKLGRHRDDYTLGKVSKLCLLFNESTIVFKGKCSIGDNFLLRVVDKGILTFGEYVWLGSSVSVFCFNNIEIGDYSSITFNSKLMDSNCHYIVNTDSQIVKPILGSVSIGRFNWIGNSSTIMKGCATGDYVNVASNSLLNKSYIDLGNNILLAGSPAVKKVDNVRRIFSPIIEKRVNQFYATNPNGRYVMKSVDFDDTNGLGCYF